MTPEEAAELMANPEARKYYLAGECDEALQVLIAHARGTVRLRPLRCPYCAAEGSLDIVMQSSGRYYSDERPATIDCTQCFAEFTTQGEGHEFPASWGLPAAKYQR